MTTSRVTALIQLSAIKPQHKKKAQQNNMIKRARVKTQVTENG